MRPPTTPPAPLWSPRALRALVRARSLSQRALAARVDAPRSSVSSWLAGDTQPDEPTAEAVARVLRVRRGDLGSVRAAMARLREDQRLRRAYRRWRRIRTMRGDE